MIHPHVTVVIGSQRSGKFHAGQHLAAGLVLRTGLSGSVTLVDAMSRSKFRRWHLSPDLAIRPDDDEGETFTEARNVTYLRQTMYVVWVTETHGPLPPVSLTTKIDQTIVCTTPYVGM